MVSPKIHICGPGSIGALLATSLSSTVPPAYVTYLMRSENRLREYQRHDSTIRMDTMAGGPKGTIEKRIQGSFPFDILRNGDPEPIENLIITTKGHQVRNALERIMPALNPSSNVLLLHNGLGVYDSVIKELWPDPGDRPRISIGVTSHAVHRVSQTPWTFKHVHSGFLKVSRVPRYVDEEKLAISQGQATDAEENVRAEYMEDVFVDRTSKPSHSDTTNPTASEESVKADYANLEAPKKKGIEPDAAESAMPTDSEAAAKADYAFAEDLKNENSSASAGDGTDTSDIFRALQSCGAMLNTEILPYPELLLVQYEKLVINSVINPLTAILGVRNGELLELDHFENIVKGAVNEATRTLKKHAESVYSPDTWFVVNSALEPKRMTQLVLDMCKQTGHNQSSMLSDVNRGTETELEFINDYIVQLAAKQGQRAVCHQLLSDLVNTRLELVRKSSDEFMPLVD